VLDLADLEMNLLEFRQRQFQFERRAEVEGTPYIVFTRTETEDESRFRPKLVHLKVVVPQAWVVHDEANDVLRVAKDGSTLPVRLAEPVVEVGAEPSHFLEQGVAFRRAPSAARALVYAPEELAPKLLRPEGFAALGID
jgi:hypothetical protein